MVVTLRIKKKYFDQILNGTKRVEYRDCKAFYERLFRDAHLITRLRLHYQKKIMLECEVDAIRRIEAPAHLADTGLPFSAEVFAIAVRNAALVR